MSQNWQQWFITFCHQSWKSIRLLTQISSWTSYKYGNLKVIFLVDLTVLIFKKTLMIFFIDLHFYVDHMFIFYILQGWCPKQGILYYLVKVLSTYAKYVASFVFHDAISPILKEISFKKIYNNFRVKQNRQQEWLKISILK